ncbi:YtcA family lipoprotein [Chelatococcus asaccharovorans]|uniref:Uncharacterized protein YtcA n=1 Tax=Chelatococcus asaccharovorans TaxID=28210 RepID=A0A2V3UCH4_9HYPH|nr:YtcA family lipoprotein [Chelatococcus asaccharovorans]MBS7703587.1 hypothetical protein [Chelatococcus asaccharovorans]PXW61931.1 YtcA family uncharacterized protein [Chelatococcus asaccharovorans]CAH1669872.1 conserved membrane hypothetical protein [Chelatococcus asaccharovorans]CAH1678708.1 conserved membrane hypothetical protein [Chelatococcus asaccharovorans]
MSFNRLILAACLPLAGCTSVGAPSLPLFGAYFPAWLACAVAGILGAVVIRVIFIPIGIDDVLPWRLLVYVCLALAIAFAVSRFVFGR